MLKINLENISSVNLSGRGGKEELVVSLFSNKLTRESKALYDLIDADTGKKYELKKQKDLQWLDPSKYYNLSEEDKQITMVFVCYQTSGVDLIFTCSLGDLIEIEYSEEIVTACRNVRIVDPSIQTKKGLKTRSFLKSNRSICNVLYENSL
ncbi:hypothetical protein [Vibrio owensii]|uniref:hypothetical protein n=1 Tax=Vibrio owensii TaxID=696485 RepID=UPI0018F13E6B|nr:hypothetical protein [Vibrio owensii]